MSNHDEVTLSDQDIDSVLEFAEHFGIELPPNLAQLCEESRKGIDLEIQYKLKLEVSKWLCESDASIFKENVFRPVIKSCRKFLKKEGVIA
jgi:hypothetical protein